MTRLSEWSMQQPGGRLLSNGRKVLVGCHCLERVAAGRPTSLKDFGDGARDEMTSKDETNTTQRSSIGQSFLTI